MSVQAPGVLWRASELFRINTKPEWHGPVLKVTKAQIVTGPDGVFTVVDSAHGDVSIFQDGRGIVVNGHGAIVSMSHIVPGQEQPFLRAYHQSEIR